MTNIPQAQKVTTRTLMQRLFRTSAFAHYKSHYDGELKAPTLSQYVTELCKKRGQTHEEIIRRAGLDRVYGHQIFSGLRMPTRDKVIQLAFGFGMDDEEAQALLKIARKSALYPRIERDAALLFCLHKRMSFWDAQDMLSELELPMMGKEQQRD